MSDKLLERIAAALETIAAKRPRALDVPEAAPAKAATVKPDKPAGAAPGGTPGGKPAAKPAAGKGASGSAPSGQTKGPGGKHTQDEVRDIIRRVVIEKGNESTGGKKGEGTKLALNLLDEIGNVTNVGQLKPEFYDAVYEACAGLLGDPDGADDANDDDPLA